VTRSPGIARLSLPTVAVFLLASSSASGYVRKRTDGGIPEYWQVSCIPLSIYMYGFTDMTRDQVAKSVGAAAHTWSPSAVTCPDGVSHPFLEIVPSMAGDDDVPPRPGYDGRNTFLFFSEVLAPPPTSPLQLGSSIIALTSTWARADGHIVDADVQINAMDYTWTNRDPGFVPPDGSDADYDLQNAVTHELGHLQGLGHTCWAPFSDEEQPIDDKDAGVPMCLPLPDPSVTQTVMFALIDSNREISKRVLSSDEIRAVCDIYPSSADPHLCGSDTPDDGCGCSAAPMAPVGVSLVLVLVGIAIARSRAHARG
jgi:hypothetical protein